MMLNMPNKTTTNTTYGTAARRGKMDDILREAKELIPLERVVLDLGGLHAENNRYECPMCVREHGPGHNRASYLINEHTHLGKCFRCNADGDIFALTAKMNPIIGGYYNAVDHVLEKYGAVELLKRYRRLRRRLSRDEIDARTDVRNVLQDIVKFGKEEIDDPRVVEYYRSRGLTKSMITKYEGFFFGEKSKQKLLAKYGSEQFIRDTYHIILYTFEKRLSFPVRDRSRRIMSLASRLIPEVSSNKEGKWVKTLGYTDVKYKRSIVEYYINEDRQPENVSEATCVLVEGIFDAMILEEHYGSDHIIIPLIGADVPEELLRRVSLYKRVVLMLDGDGGGSYGMFKCYVHNRLGLDIDVAPLKDGHDPAEATKEENIHALENTVPIRDYIIDYTVGLIEDGGDYQRLRTVFTGLDKVDSVTALYVGNIAAKRFEEKLQSFNEGDDNERRTV